MEPETAKIDDLVVLCNAVPYEIKGGRQTVCVAGYSDRLGLIRVYPTPPGSPAKRWNRIGMPLARNPQDTRKESWKIQGSKDDWGRLAGKIAPHGIVPPRARPALWSDLCDRYQVGCVNDLNDRRLSLGIVKPNIKSYSLEERHNHDPTVQLTLTSETPFKTIRNYKWKPVVRYSCPRCKAKNGHEQQVIEWGVYEWFRKRPGEEEKVWDNLRLADPGWDTWFLVGNQALHRNAFMIISVVRFKSADRGQARLFD